MLWRILIFLWIVVTSVAADVRMPPEIVQSIADMEVLRAEIENIKSLEMPYGTYASLCERAYQTEDVSLIALCLDKLETSHEMWMRLRQEQSENMRKRNVLILLRAKPEIWGESANSLGDPVSGPLNARSEYCMPILRRYLSEEILGRYSFIRAAHRQQLANLLEKAPLLSENPSKPLDWRWVSAAGMVILLFIVWRLCKARSRKASTLV